jgi:signal transduction histidine kinase
MPLSTIVRRVWRPLGVRMRTALAAGLVVAVASVLTGAALLVTARGILLASINTAATDRANQVVAALSSGDTATLTAALRPSARERTVVQVLNPAGAVVAESEAIAGSPPISPLRPPSGHHRSEERRLAVGRDEPFWIVAVGVNTTEGLRTVLVAESLDTVGDGTEAILVALAVGLPLLALVVGAATFLFVGRSMRPVEAMRRQADTITAENLHARLPVPAADDEIAALAATMNTMLDRIEAASATQRRFVADASHELRSPLATIHANVDLLAAAPLPEPSARSVDRIHTESARMGRLVDDLLLLARVDDQGLRLRRQDVDLDDLVYAERERLALQHPGIEIEGTVDPVRVTGDPDHLHRVLRNLVDNAARHAKHTVTISLASDGCTGEVVVGNDGPAIAAGDREKIFDRFVRLDDSRSRQGGGAGLGLPIARDIVVAHGGTLTVADSDAGAALVIRLPLPT